MTIDPVSLAITAGLMALQMALTASQEFEGPRLDSLDVSVADPGTGVPRFWGIARIDGCPYIWAEKLREVKKTSKTKGGKYTNYKYYGTWSCLITDQGTATEPAIEAVRRIWFDKHLVFQRHAVGPIGPVMGIIPGPLGIDIKLQWSNNIRIYEGTNDQKVDPRIEAWCEDRYGQSGLAPAYARKAHIVLEEIPLEKFGNRIPQVNIEAVRSATIAFLAENLGAATSADRTWSFGGGWGYYATGSGTGEWWDMASRTRVGTSPQPGYFSGSVNSIAHAPDGTAHYYGVATPAGTCYTTCPPLGYPTITEVGPGSPSIQHGRVRFLQSISPPFGSAVCGFTAASGYMINATHIIEADRSLRDSCEDEDGAWGLFQPIGASDEFIIEQIGSAFPVSYTFTGAMRAGVTPARITPLEGKFIVAGGDGNWYHFDKESETLTVSEPAPWGSHNPDFANQGAASYWHPSAFAEYDLRTGELLNDFTRFDWPVPNGAADAYDPINHAIIFDQTASNNLWICYLERIGSSDVTLGQVLSDVADWAGVKRHNFNALDQLIPGWLVSPGSARNMVEPLLTVHDSDVRSTGFQLEGLKRGGAPTGSTLLTKHFAKDGEEPRFRIRIAQDQTLPLRLTVNFSDTNKDHQNNNVVAARAADSVVSKRTPSIDMGTYVSTPDVMKPLADRALRRMWRDRESMQFALTAQELGMTPGDVRSFVCDTLERTGRLERMTLTGRGGSLIKCEFRRDAPSVATLSTGIGAELVGRDPDVIFSTSATFGVILDIPLLADTHEISAPQLYYGGTRYAAELNWPGAIVWRLDAVGTDYDPWAEISSSDEITCGLATDTLADANPRLWDRGNSVNVRIFGGATLSNASEADINADRNLNLAALKCADGSVELLNFTTATIEANGTWTLSGLKRGRRGTEGAIGSHAGGDVFVLLSGVAREALGLSDVGLTETFRVATVGRDPVSAPPLSLVPFTGASLKPRPPCQPYARRDEATGDWAFRWIRRTRVGGAWVGGSPIPLSENSEAYEVAIPIGGGDFRTIAVTTPAATWTAAEQTTDLGAPQTSLPAGVLVYQMSDAVGRGFASPSALAA